MSGNLLSSMKDFMMVGKRKINHNIYVTVERKITDDFKGDICQTVTENLENRMGMAFSSTVQVTGLSMGSDHLSQKFLLF